MVNVGIVVSRYIHLDTESWPDFPDLYAVRIKCLMEILLASFITVGISVFVKLGKVEMNHFQIWRLDPL